MLSAKEATSHTWTEQGQWTFEDWVQLPDDGYRYEVINGVLFMSPPPTPYHQASSNRLATAMTNHADKHDVGVILTAPIAILLPNQPVPVQPDIVFIRQAQKAIIGKQQIVGVPDLIVEILSPSNWLYDRQEKFQLYQEAGVEEYWLVEYRTKTVELFWWEEGVYVLQGKYKPGDTVASRILTGFKITVNQIYRDLP
jgi:Uma2 family endonuclease